MIDSQKQEFDNIAIGISNDPKLTLYMVEHPYGNFGDYKANSAILDKLFFCTIMTPMLFILETAFILYTLF